MLKKKIAICLATLLCTTFLGVNSPLNVSATTNFNESSYINVERNVSQMVVSNYFSSYNGTGDPIHSLGPVASENFTGRNLDVALKVTSLTLMNGTTINSLTNTEPLWLVVMQNGRVLYKGNCIGMKVGREVWYTFDTKINPSYKVNFYVYATNARELVGTVQITAKTN